MMRVLHDMIRKPAAAVLALGLMLAPSASFAQWWDDAGLFDDDYYSVGLFDDDVYDDDDWFYDSYGPYYSASYGGYYDDDLWEDGLFNVGLDEDGLYRAGMLGYPDYSDYYEDDAFEDDDWLF